MNDQYLYAYYNDCYSYNSKNFVKIGSTCNPISRYFTYMTSFPIAGTYTKVIRIEQSAKNCYELDAQLQNDCRNNDWPFTKVDLGGGQEFYDVGDIDEILNWLRHNGVKYTDVTANYRDIKREIAKVDNVDDDDEFRLQHLENKLVKREKEKIAQKAILELAHGAITRQGLRPYQQDTIKKAIDHYNAHNIGNLIYICGAGKTVTSYYISCAIGANKVVIFVPSIYLASQFRDDWQKELKAGGNISRILLVCCDATVNNSTEYVELLTEKHHITSKLSEPYDGKTIVICTYQSHKKLVDVAKEINYQFDFGIYDEAHKTTGYDAKQFSQSVTIPESIILKKLFMTATPKIYSDDPKQKPVLSMDDESKYGKRIDAYNMRQAINDGTLCDYEIHCLHVSDAMISNLIVNENLVMFNNNEDDSTKANYVASALSILQMVASKRCTHIITYHDRVDDAKRFVLLLNKLHNVLYDNDTISITSIDGDTSMKNRQQLIRDFENSKLSIICSAHVLDVGINIPVVDCVCFVDPRNSTINIIQCIGRAVRVYKGMTKTKAIIIVPVVDEGNPNKYKMITNILKSLKETDIEIVERFNSGKLIKHSGISRNSNNIDHDSITTTEVNNIDIAEWNNKIKTVLSKKEDSLNDVIVQYTDFVHKNNKLPRAIDSAEKKMKTEHRKQALGKVDNRDQQEKLANSIESYRRAHKNLTPEQVEQFNNLPGWYWAHEIEAVRKIDKFSLVLEKVKQFIDTNKHLPSINTSDIHEWLLGSWCNDQCDKIKKASANEVIQKQIMELEKISCWTGLKEKNNKKYQLEYPDKNLKYWLEIIQLHLLTISFNDEMGYKYGEKLQGCMVEYQDRKYSDTLKHVLIGRFSRDYDSKGINLPDQLKIYLHCDRILGDIC